MKVRSKPTLGYVKPYIHLSTLLKGTTSLPIQSAPLKGRREITAKKKVLLYHARQATHTLTQEALKYSNEDLYKTPLCTGVRKKHPGSSRGQHQAMNGGGQWARPVRAFTGDGALLNCEPSLHLGSWQSLWDQTVPGRKAQKAVVLQSVRRSKEQPTLESFRYTAL